MEGVIIDVDHVDEGGQTFVRLFLKGKEGAHEVLVPFDHFFYLIPAGDPEEVVEAVKKIDGVKNAEIVKRIVGREKKRVVKITVIHPKHVQGVKEQAEVYGECREYDISIEKRFFLEKRVAPFDYVVVDSDVRRKEGQAHIRFAALDIEVYARDRLPDPTKDPVVMVAYVDEEVRTVITTKSTADADFVRRVSTETELFSELNRLIKERDPDVIMGYNSDLFDLPYLKERAKVLGIKLRWGRDGSEPRIRKAGGRRTSVDITGRMHVDVYRIIEFMAGIGAINTFRLDLESVYRAVLGKEKTKIAHRDIAGVWDNGDVNYLAQYNLEDAVACFELGMEFIQLYVELCRLTHSNLYETTRMSPSQIVEWRLIGEAFERGVLVPKRPKADEVKKRRATTYKGAYVREPVPGLHENIAVFDFRSLYPSIIISHNVGPDTLEGDCDEYYESPNGHRFCKEPEGLIPGMLRTVLKKRAEYKKKMKQHPRDSAEYKVLYAKQQALKIIANSTYGYMGFAMARWYCRACAEAITAWARKYIRETMDEAEKTGLKVIYGDTDSLFCVVDDPKSINEFLDKINARLPPPMELELEGVYKRGLFITKRGGERAAKKKYALVDENGRLKITGLEYVRRDWAEIAKDVQRKVLEYVLVKGDPEEAVDYVKKVIKDVREGKVPKEKLIIYTQIQREIGSYEQKGPHVLAALKAMQKGIPIAPGTIIGYIITKGPGKISERAEPAPFAGEKDYDPEYYVKHQIIPAVLPILEELGYTEKDLEQHEGQKTLFDFT